MTCVDACLSLKTRRHVDGHHIARVLSRAHSGGIECATLGHGFTGKTVAHPYFGTQRVIDDLAAMRGWADGLVELEGADEQTVRRDPETGLVCGLTQRS